MECSALNATSVSHLFYLSLKKREQKGCKSRSWWEFCETAFSEHYRAIAYKNSKMKWLLEQDPHMLKQSQFHCGYRKNSYILNTSRDAIGRWCSLGKRESVFFSYVYLGMLPLLQWITRCVWVHKHHELDSVSFKKMIWSWEGSVGCLKKRKGVMAYYQNSLYVYIKFSKKN